MASAESPEEMAGWPSMRYMPPQQVEAWRQQKSNFLSSPGYDEARFAQAFVRAIAKSCLVERRWRALFAPIL